MRDQREEQGEDEGAEEAGGAAKGSASIIIFYALPCIHSKFLSYVVSNQKRRLRLDLCSVKNWNTEFKVRDLIPLHKVLKISDLNENKDAADDFEDNSIHFPDNDDKEEEGEFIRRRKRQTGKPSSSDKAIELAVFVDDDLYDKEISDTGLANPVASITNLVYTYLNSVGIE